MKSDAQNSLKIQLNMYIAVTEGSTQIWLLYTGDLYIEVEPIWKLCDFDIKSNQFGFWLTPFV